VQALQTLDKDAKWWIERQVNFNTHPAARQAVREKLQGNPEYARKIGIIQNSLFGVDIQPIAAEISKLRCFLTLIVDENINDNLTNRGIDPLPNLEFKFVTANTLVVLPEEHDFGGLFNANDDLTQLEGIRQEYLQSYGENKGERKTQFKTIQDKIAKQQITSRVVDVNSRAFMISTWDPFAHAKSDWFDQKWMFGVAKFDLVIGNPPYRIMTKNNTQIDLLEKYKMQYKTIKNSNSKNLYIAFIEKGLTLIRNGGVVSFIVPEGLFKTRSYSDCVQLLNLKGSVTSITTFSSMVFDNATTGNLIFSFTPNIKVGTKEFHFNGNYQLGIKNTKDVSITDKIKGSNRVLDNCCNLFKGMVVADRKLMIGDTAESGSDIFLLGKSIDKWIVKKKFFANYSKLKIIGGTKVKSKHDVAPRIIIRRTGNSLCSALITERALTESTLYSCWPKNQELNIKYVLSLLNSSVLTYYIRQMMVTNEQAFPQILMTDLADLPIYEPDQITQDTLQRVAEYVIFCLGNGKDTKINTHVPDSHLAQIFGEVIDAMIMELYFKEDFKNAGIKFIEYGDRDFISIEGRPEQEQIQIVHGAYQKLREKDNEIRNNLKLMDIKLSEIVLPIKSTI
jgi:hypothetical protein